MDKTTKYTIYRDSWLRGEETKEEGGGQSYLFRPEDKKMCCLGQIGVQAGIPLRSLSEVSTLGNLPATDVPVVLGKKLLNPSLHGSKFSLDNLIAEALMERNDMKSTGDDTRKEIDLTALFANIGIEVSFVDGIAPWFVDQAV